jgi:hypothetical protein
MAKAELTELMGVERALWMHRVEEAIKAGDTALVAKIMIEWEQARPWDFAPPKSRPSQMS